MRAKPAERDRTQVLRVAWVDGAAPPRWLTDRLAQFAPYEYSGCFGTGRRDMTRLAAVGPDIVLVGRDVAADLTFHSVRRLKMVVPGAQLLLLGDPGSKGGPAEFNEATTCGAIMLGARLQPTAIDAGARPKSMVGGPQPTLATPASLLTAREHEVLVLLTQGARYKEIAEALGITYNTVHTHVRRVFKKLQVRSVTQAALKYLSLSIQPTEECRSRD